MIRLGGDYGQSSVHLLPYAEMNPERRSVSRKHLESGKCPPHDTTVFRQHFELTRTTRVHPALRRQLDSPMPQTSLDELSVSFC